MSPLVQLFLPQSFLESFTDEEFGRARAGEAIELLTTALLEELVDFFPQGKRQLLRKAIAKLETMLAVVSDRLDSPELDAQLLAELRMLGDSSDASPAS